MVPAEQSGPGLPAYNGFVTGFFEAEQHRILYKTSSESLWQSLKPVYKNIFKVTNYQMAFILFILVMLMA